MKPCLEPGSSFWSGTGNTETMANAVVEGLKGAGAVLACDSVMANSEPDDDAIAACKAIAASLV